MPIASHFLYLLTLALPAQEVITYRQWLGNEEVGTLVVRQENTPKGLRHTTRELVKMARKDIKVSQEFEESALRSGDGSISYTWTIRLANEPMKGEATWSPKDPSKLMIRPASGAARSVDVPPSAILWVPDQDARMKEAALKRAPIHITSFTFATQQWSELDLTPIGPDPLPGFPDTVRFKGTEQKSGLTMEVEVWISPSHGELKSTTDVMGLQMLLQRAELPGPVTDASLPGVFGQTLKSLPHHPFLPWLDVLTVRFSGSKPQTLPEDPQQRHLEKNRYCLLKAAVPSQAESKDMPVKGKASSEDAPYLANTPLVDFKDPVFDGLLFRLKAPERATRWELAKLVTRFVFEWIDPKDFTVGFATAQEVARNAKGDCTEHSVLAVALLRKLGVPTRGVVGWIAMGDTLGLHFWVEANVGGRWIPMDPTFGEAPASAFRIKLGTTDLADMGSVGWDSAASVFGHGSWTPETENGIPWGQSGIRIEGEKLSAPGGIILRAKGGKWQMTAGHLELELKGFHGLEAIPMPPASWLTGIPSSQSSLTSLKGWWKRKEKTLVVSGGERWLRLSDVEESTINFLLDHLLIQESRP